MDKSELMQSATARRHALVGPADLWESKRRFQKDFLLRAGLKPHHRLLDFGCGTLRGGIPIIDYLDAGNYIGLDVRTETLKEACVELEESGLDVKYPTIMHCHNLSVISFHDGVDFIWAFSVLIHLSDEKLDQFLAFASQSLSPSGNIYANVFLGNQPDGIWRNFCLVRRTHDFYKSRFDNYGLAAEDIGELRDFGHISHAKTEEEEASHRMLKISAR
jgi:cyclopropane fatty-acyl-phospholipid synthase-like methyltransferase